MNNLEPEITGTANGEAIVRAENVHKTYVMGATRLDVLRGINLAVRRGEFVALCGASGAGKSTLLHLLGGLDLPNAGDVYFEDKNLRRLSNQELSQVRNRRVGFVFQAYHLLPELNALENVCLPGRMARRPMGEVEAAARKLLERVGLGERMVHRPYELSGGEQQRVAIARALINDPTLVLADEPTGNLDSHTGEEIFHLLCALREERNATLIMATHDRQIANRAERIVELADGKQL